MLSSSLSAKRNKIGCWLLIAAAILLICCWHVFGSNFFLTSTSTKKTAIVLLGGGLKSTGELYPHVELRLGRSVEIYHSLVPDNFVRIIPLSGGTPHKPPPHDSRGFPIAESRAAVQKLVEKYKINPEHIEEEAFSLDTLGNAYFFRTAHVDPGRYTDLIIVTNSWHMPRVKEIFSIVMELPFEVNGNKRLLNIQYEEVGAVLEGKLLESRKKREKESLNSFVENVKPKLNSLQELHDFIFIQHKAYNAKRLLLDPPKPIDPTVLDSY